MIRALKCPSCGAPLHKQFNSGQPCEYCRTPLILLQEGVLKVSKSEDMKKFDLAERRKVAEYMENRQVFIEQPEKSKTDDLPFMIILFLSALFIIGFHFVFH